jgi:hypothetical protein
MLSMKNLFYVLGALLGDVYIYKWKNYYFVGILVAEHNFAKKFASKLSSLGRPAKAYFYRRRKLWFVRQNNRELFELFRDLRKDPISVIKLAKYGDFNKNSLQFVEGFFDAEGCVKLVKEKVRKTPKFV